ncbi:MAG: hypothetical protein Q8L95_01855 [Burkholderiales bacterium]|nr:hypothetical protein [Burkholderiales bacterium]
MKAGFIGLGAMALNLRKADFEPVVHDVRPDAAKPQLGVPMRVASLAHADMIEVLNRGWAKRDSRVAMLLQEERAGVEMVAAAEIQAVLHKDG